MRVSLAEFHTDFLQSILSGAESRGLMTPQSFFEIICDDLVTIGDLTRNCTVAEYSKRGLEVYGYDYDEERKTLTLLAHQYFQEDVIQTLTQAQIDIKLKRLKSFFNKCCDKLYLEMEETSDAYSMAYSIYNYLNNGQITKVRFMILTDGKATRTLEDMPPETHGLVTYEYRIIDIEYIYKIYAASNNTVEFDVEVELPCLEVNTASDEYQSYLCILSGGALVDIYEKYGHKLFEQNVRTFLQFKGNVNKGIRNTIEYSPTMFFAYNNGITATSSSVDIDDAGRIAKIRNFQIVNGAQTTSAIYAANKNSKMDVSKISVQMKLSVVKDPEKQNEFVSKVSEYANTQNKVNKSDFFSNSPFHKDFKNYSQRTWVSAMGGSQKRTHWFYERVRGEYLNEQAYLTPSQKKQFQLENPKNQLLDKLFLSKSEMSWYQSPHIVSKGAQDSFSAFAERVTSILEKDPQAVTETYFKSAISKCIIFRQVEKIVSDAAWYDGGYRAQVVTYTVAYLANMIESKRGRILNYNLIWESQKIPDSLIEALEVIAAKVYEDITNPPSGSANVAQWCKKAECWGKVISMRAPVEIDDKILMDREVVTQTRLEDKRNKAILSGIEMQMFVVSQKQLTWDALNKYYKKNAGLKLNHLDILNKMSLGQLRPPSEKQAIILYELYQRAIAEGMVVST